jgi:hypothetical protein
MRRRVAIAFTALTALGLLVASASSGATADPGKKNPGLLVVKAFASAPAAGAIASATATCPKTQRPDLGPWRAISAGFEMQGVVPVFTTVGRPPSPPSGSGVVYESRKVGQRSWRVSAQSLSGTFSLSVSLYCQNSVPKTTQDMALTAPAATPQVGPTAVARCRSGKTVSGGFSTAPPFTATGPTNMVIASMPSGKKAWGTQVLSWQGAGISSVSSYVYCAKRKRVRVVHSLLGEPSSIASNDGMLAYGNTYDPSCPKGRFLPGGGGFSETGSTTSQYLIPVTSHQQGGGTIWHAHGLKVGSGVSVSMTAYLVCG